MTDLLESCWFHHDVGANSQKLSTEEYMPTAMRINSLRFILIRMRVLLYIEKHLKESVRFCCLAKECFDISLLATDADNLIFKMV